MTSAKLQSMAAQTDAPDDLIAELARLMADEARATPPASEPAAPVRIPGEQTATPVPRFDFSASSTLNTSRAPASPVRIPGNEPAATSAPAGQAADPFAFDFNLAPKTPDVTSAAPRSAASVAQPEAGQHAASAAIPERPAAPAREPAPALPADEPAMLDQDSLADLIAAELAADLGNDRGMELAPQSEPASPGSDSDSFGVPPVFGLGSPQQAVAPQAPAIPQPEPVVARQEPVVAYPEPVAAAVREEAVPVVDPAPRASDSPRDPLEEIEELVGPAVRLNKGSAAPLPSLRALATPDPVEPVVGTPETPAPEPVARASDIGTGVASVDEAILAAAAATGARVEWVNPDAADTADADDMEPAPAQRRPGFRLNRAVAGPLVAVGLLAVAGGGLYWLLGQGGSTSGPAPLLVADTTPAKDVPAPDTSEPAPQSVVFNEISGNNTPAEEQIVSRDQADTEAVVAANTPVTSSGVLSDASGTNVDPNQDGLVNRKVRTVTVRPDGTIVSGSDSLAGSSILPVDRPNVPEVPGADFSTPELLASTGTEATAPTASAQAPTDAPTPAAVPAEPGSVIPVVDATGAPVAGRSVTVPMQRPSDFSAMAAAAIAAANAAPAAAPQALSAPSAPQAAAPAATTPVTNAAAYVQLASQRSEADALATVQAVTTRYGVLFGGASPQVQRVDLGERGIYYRVLVPAASREGAANICANVKAAGGDCLVL